MKIFVRPERARFGVTSVVERPRPAPRPMISSLRFAAGASVVVGALAFAGPPASAADAVSGSNWAGYVASRPGVRFSRVSGTWVQPAVSCRVGAPAKTSIWVGLGGDRTGTLEQIGTEADCGVDGRATYSAWWELVPSASASVHLRVRAGDVISASVTVSAPGVALRMANETQRTTFVRRFHAAPIDVTSAEWIVEAPALCLSASSASCRDSALADFGSTGFTRARATVVGHIGTITDAGWSAAADTLGGGASSRAGQRATASSTHSSSATPGALSGVGDAFSVTFGA